LHQLAIFAQDESDKGDILPYDLRVDFLENPQGIDVSHPRFSWKLKLKANATEQHQTQTAYQIILTQTIYTVNKDDLHTSKVNTKNKDIWDSGKVTKNSVLVELPKEVILQEKSEYLWTLVVWDKNDNHSPLTCATFTTGFFNTASPDATSFGNAGSNTLTAPIPYNFFGYWIGADVPALTPTDVANLQNAIYKASWIWSDQKFKTAPVGKTLFRKAFNLTKNYKVNQPAGKLFISADNSFTAYLNDKKIGTGNDFHKVYTFDVSDFLRHDKNVLAVEVVNDGESPNPAGLIGVLAIQNGAEELSILTNNDWKANSEPLAKSELADFDDSAWKVAEVVARFGEGPWGVIGNESVVSPPARYLTKKFRTYTEKGKRIPVRATAYISGLGYYEFYLDGQKIGDHVLDPILTDYNKRVPYVTYELDAKLLNDFDEHKLQVILGNGRYHAPRQNNPTRTLSYGYPKLLFSLHIYYSDGTQQTIGSDTSWKLSTNGKIRDNNDNDGEIFDARKTDFEEEYNAQLVSSPNGKLASQMMPPMKIVEEFEALSVKEVREGVWIFDFGVNVVGNCKLRIPSGLLSGTQLQLRHAETLAADGNLYTANLRGAKCRDIYIASGNESLSSTPTYYSPTFTYHGFRYAELTGLPSGVKADKKMLTARAINTNLRKVGKLKTSNKTINAIFKNIVRGTQGNYLSIPTDCPQRDERQGWQGDRAAESKGEMFLFDNATLYAKWLVDIEDSQRKDGNLSDVCPNYWPLYNSNVTWPSAFIIVPDNLYTMYGDLRPIERHYDAMKGWLIRHLGQFVRDGIIDKDNYGDWCVPPERPELIHSKDPKRKTAKAVLATSYYIHCLDLLTKYAKLLGKNDESEHFAKQSEVMKSKFNARFFNKETCQYDNGSQTSSVLALRFDIVHNAERWKVFNGLVDNIENGTNNHIGTGLIGGQWINRVLTDGGRGDIAYKFTTHKDYPSWGYMVNKGATTIWELWNGDTANPEMNSGNHVMLIGDLVIWYYEYLAGIKADPSRPGFEHVIMRPHVFGDLEYVQAEYESVRGLISSHWTSDGNKFRWEIELPPGVTADVILPDGCTRQNIPSGKHVFSIRSNEPLTIK
jgi:alpha-L-rhamnosidase